MLFDEVEQIRPAFGDAEKRAGTHAVVPKMRRSAARGVNFVAVGEQALYERDERLLVFVAHAHENFPGAGNSRSRGDLAFQIRERRAAVQPHDFAGGLHFRGKQDVDAGKAREREHGFLDRRVPGGNFFREAELAQRRSRHHARGELRQRNAGRLRNEGNGARRARIRLKHENFSVPDGELNVHQPAHAQRGREPERVRANLRLDRLGKRRRGNHAGGISGMNARVFDVFHDAADDRRFAVGDAVDVDFRRVPEIAVDQHRTAFGNFDGVFHVGAQRGLVMHDDHRAPAEHEGRTHQHGIADFRGDGGGAVDRRRRRSRRLKDPRLLGDGGEKPAVFRRVDHFRRGADDVRAVRLQPVGEVERRLPAELHDDAVAFFPAVNREHVFKRERLEVKFVRRVVIGRNRFRI